jgi:hypothetical protein
MPASGISLLYPAIVTKCALELTSHSLLGACQVSAVAALLKGAVSLVPTCQHLLIASASALDLQQPALAAKFNKASASKELGIQLYEAPRDLLLPPLQVWSRLLGGFCPGDSRQSICRNVYLHGYLPCSTLHCTGSRPSVS